MGGGKNKQYNLNLRKAFADTPDSSFESYVDSKGDLANAWRLIDTYQKGGDMSGFAMHGDMTPAQQAQYWIRKAEGGRFNKADFGRFHAAEDKALFEGNYPGGTKVRKGTGVYSQYFPDNTTRYAEFVSGTNSGTGNEPGPDRSGLLDPPEAANPFFPMLVPDYEVPSYTPMTNPWTGQVIDASYQPWTREGGNFHDYVPPQLKLARPRYIQNPLGLLELPEDWEDLLTMAEEEGDDDDENPTEGPHGTEEGSPHQ